MIIFEIAPDDKGDTQPIEPMPDDIETTPSLLALWDFRPALNGYHKMKTAQGIVPVLSEDD